MCRSSSPQHGSRAAACLVEALLHRQSHHLTKDHASPFTTMHAAAAEIQTLAMCGKVGGADSSASVELTGPADPLRLSARHELDLVARTLHVSFVLYNRLPGEVAGATVRCRSMSLPLRSELGSLCASGVRSVAGSARQSGSRIATEARWRSWRCPLAAIRLHASLLFCLLTSIVCSLTAGTPCLLT